MGQAVVVLTVAGWDESLHDEALQIIQCESEFMPLASGDWSYGEPLAKGLMQIHWQYPDNFTCGNWEGFIGYYPYFHCESGFAGNAYDVVSNITMARLIYERSNSWSMWSCRKMLQK